MRWEGIYIAGTGLSVGVPESVTTAIEQGRYSQRYADSSGQRAVTITPPETPPHYAVMAGREALSWSGHRPDEVGTLVYSVVYDAGIPAWNPANYVQRHLGERRAAALETRIACAGGIGVLDVVIPRLLALDDDRQAALVTAADVWSTAFRSWTATSAFPLGDGGSAMVLSRWGGFVRLLSVVTETDPDMEALTRGDAPFGPSHHDADNPIDLQARAEQFLAGFGEDELWARRDRHIASVVRRALAEAGVSLGDIDHFVVPFLEASLAEREIAQPLGLDLSRSTADYGRDIGHLGAGDHYAGLHHLVESGRLRAGHRILFVAVDGCYLWAAAVADVIESPRYLRRQ